MSDEKKPKTTRRKTSVAKKTASTGAKTTGAARKTASAATGKAGAGKDSARKTVTASRPTGSKAATSRTASSRKAASTAPKSRAASGTKKSVRNSKPMMPVLPLRNIVVFPHMIVPLFVGREKSIHALDQMPEDAREIILVSQKDVGKDEPGVDDVFRVGTVASVLQLLKLPDGTVKVLVEGLRRVRLVGLKEKDGYFQSSVEDLPDELASRKGEREALARSTLNRFEDYARLNKKVAPEVLASVSQLEDPSRLADTIASHLNLRIPERQELLETLSVEERLERVFSGMEAEIDVLQVEKRIRSRVKKQMEKTQREYYLNEQMKAIQKEMGEGEDGRDELSEIEEKIESQGLSKEAKEKAHAELKKLRNMSPMSAEGTVVRSYLDWLVGLPWKKQSRLTKSLQKAEDVLEADHYGLEKIKERILEYLAVQSRAKKLKGPILCLVGPPGVGKTSLARSIARATGRKYVRMSLGGMRDESEIRGHRRTYIGAMPGKIIQGVKKAGVSNPLFLLDEVDKLGSDWRGDPSSAMLEVLDPEQNSSFGDHYLEVEYDLSDIMFITTANSLDMPQPLLDRMEIIRLSGYTEEEKLEIAKRHLLGKQAKEHNLRPGEWHVSDEALLGLIRSYTREAGVRNLERMIARLARKAVREILGGKVKHIEVTPENLEVYAGVPRFRHGEADKEDQVGIVTGLAWTQVGGEILTIESLSMPGKGNIRQTGKLGDVMKESVSAAFSYVKSRLDVFGVDPAVLEKTDIHVHLPEGAVPKDGPSAGAALTTALVSVLTRIPVRHDVAMTGEVTLRGRVLEIGGLKEKLLAALRAGIKTVLIPEMNVKDLAEIPDNVKQGLEIIPVQHMDEVLNIALTKPPKALPEGHMVATKGKKNAREGISRSFRH